MNVRELAAADAQSILNDINGAGSPFFLKPPNKPEIPLIGSYGDIGYLLNTTTGEAIEGRTIEASFSLASLFAANPAEPKKGWGFRCFSLTGKETKLFVSKYEPDRTIGIGRIKLAVNLT